MRVESKELSPLMTAGCTLFEHLHEFSVASYRTNATVSEYLNEDFKTGDTSKKCSRENPQKNTVLGKFSCTGMSSFDGGVNQKRKCLFWKEPLLKVVIPTFIWKRTMIKELKRRAHVKKKEKRASIEAH